MGEMVDGRNLRGDNTPLFVMIQRGSLERLPLYIDKRKIIWYNKVSKKKGTKP